MRAADIILTAAGTPKKPAPLIPAAWIQPGAFCRPAEYDALLAADAMSATELFSTHDVGRMDSYRTLGYFRTTPAVHGDLGEVVTGKRPGRRRAEERTMAIHLGIAVEDVLTAQRLYRRAVAAGVGTRRPR